MSLQWRHHELSRSLNKIIVDRALVHDIIYLYLYIHNRCCMSLQWRHNERDGISNHWRLDCLFKIPRHWPLWGYSTDSHHKGPVTREMFPFDAFSCCVQPCSNETRLSKSSWLCRTQFVWWLSCDNLFRNIWCMCYNIGIRICITCIKCGMKLLLKLQQSSTM